MRVKVTLAGKLRRPVTLTLESRDSEWITGIALDNVRHKIHTSSIQKVEEITDESLPRLGRWPARSTVR